MQRYVTPANMVMRRHQSVGIKQNPHLSGSFVGIETHGDKNITKPPQHPSPLQRTKLLQLGDEAINVLNLAATGASWGLCEGEIC